MTAARLLCNKCEIEWYKSYYYRHLNADAQRIIARSDGWVYYHKTDICPACRPRKKNGKLFKVNKNRILNDGVDN